MENKFLNPYDKEYMKTAMLKHEEVFREQVYELHRLYQIQKKLMKNISSTRTNGKKKDKCTQMEKRNIDNCGLEMEDEDEIELTLGPSNYYRLKKAETPVTSDSGISFSSSSTGSNRLRRTNSGLHRITETRKEESNGQKWGLVEVPNSRPSFPYGRRNTSDIEEQLRQDRLQQPPWLFQVLSLNMKT